MLSPESFPQNLDTSTVYSYSGLDPCCIWFGQEELHLKPQDKLANIWDPPTSACPTDQPVSTACPVCTGQYFIRNWGPIKAKNGPIERFRVRIIVSNCTRININYFLFWIFPPIKCCIFVVQIFTNEHSTTEVSQSK